jgi:hypothetical protein
LDKRPPICHFGDIGCEVSVYIAESGIWADAIRLFRVRPEFCREIIAEFSAKV